MSKKIDFLKTNIGGCKFMQIYANLCKFMQIQLLVSQRNNDY